MMDIRLYQINRERDEERRALLSTEALARRGSGPKVIDSSIYDCVFEGTVNCGDLEEVYTLFNVDPPENFFWPFHVRVRRGGGRQNGLFL